MLLKQCWYVYRIEGVYRYTPALSKLLRDVRTDCFSQQLQSSSCPTVCAQPGLSWNPQISIPDQWTQLLLSLLRVPPLVRWNAYPWDVYSDTSSHTDFCRQGLPTHCTSRSDVTAKFLKIPNPCDSSSFWLVVTDLSKSSLQSPRLLAFHPWLDKVKWRRHFGSVSLISSWLSSTDQKHGKHYSGYNANWCQLLAFLA